MTKKMGVFAVTGMMAAMMATGVLAEDLTKEDVSGLWYITTMEIEGMTMSPADMGLEATLEFGDDDTWEMTMSGEDPTQGTWELAGEEIIMHSDTASDVKMAIDEEGMLIGDIDSTIMTFSREKPEATDWVNLENGSVTILVPEDTTDEQMELLAQKFQGSAIITDASQVKRGTCQMSENPMPDIAEILSAYGLS